MKRPDEIIQFQLGAGNRPTRGTPFQLRAEQEHIPDHSISIDVRASASSKIFQMRSVRNLSHASPILLLAGKCPHHSAKNFSVHCVPKGEHTLHNLAQVLLQVFTTTNLNDTFVGTRG